jgi:methyl-accepting chemotaxis protein
MKLLNVHSIKTNMILLLGSIILVFSVGMGLMSYYISSQALIGNMDQMLPEMAKESALLIEHNIETNFGSLDAIIYNLKDPNLNQSDCRKLQSLGRKTEPSDRSLTHYHRFF